jgi:hypothetical protein
MLAAQANMYCRGDKVDHAMQGPRQAVLICPHNDFPRFTMLVAIVGRVEQSLSLLE